MTRIIILFIFLTPSLLYAQKIKKDKSASIQEITNSGRTVYKLENKPNSFYYKRYDAIGESTVVYICENNQVRKVLFFSEDPQHPAKRALEAFKTIDDGYEVDPDLKGVFKGTNSCYYQGKARYEGITNYTKKLYYLEIIILD